MLLEYLNLAALISSALAWSNITRSNQSHRVVAFWGEFHEDDGGAVGPYLPLLPVIKNSSGITDLILFICDIHNNTPHVTVGGYAPDNTTWLPTQFWDDVHTLQDNDINVLASFGGYGSDMFLLLEQDFEYYYPFMRDFLHQYNLSGIDLDIEPNTNTLTPFARGETILKLIKQINADFGSDFLVSLDPVPDDLTDFANDPPFFSGFNYKILDDLATDDDGNHIINWFNGQFLNGYATCNDTSVYDQIIQSGGYDPSRVVWLVTTNTLDASGWCNITELAGVAGELAQNYSNFGGVGGYEYFYAGAADNITRIQWYQEMAAAIGS